MTGEHHNRPGRAVALLTAAALLATPQAAFAVNANPNTNPNRIQTLDANDATPAERLETAIQQAENKTADTKRQWDETLKAAFDQALTDARNIRDKTGATDDERTVAAAALETATTNLKSVAQTNLATMQDTVAGLEEDEYTPDSWTLLQSAVSTMNGRYSDDSAGDVNLQAAVDAVRDAIDALIPGHWPDYQTALNRARTEQARNLTYDGKADKNLADAIGEYADLTAESTNTDLEKAATQLNAATDAVQKKDSDQKKQLDQTISEAAKLSNKDGAYLEAGWTAFEEARTAAGQVDATTASASDFTSAATRLDTAMENLRPSAWTFHNQNLSDEDGDGVWEGEIRLDAIPTDPKAVSRNGDEIRLDAQTVTGFTQGSEKLGVGEKTSRLTRSTEASGMSDVNFNITAITPTGSETTVNTDDMTGVSLKAGAFTLKDGVWTADGTATLGSGRAENGSVKDATAWAGGDLKLSDGSILSDPTLGEVQTVRQDGRTTWTRTVAYTGADSHGTNVTVNITASYTYDPTITLNLTRQTADGTVTPIEVPDATGADVTAMNDRITVASQPYDAVGDNYTLTVGDLTGGNIRVDGQTGGVREDGTRDFVLTVTADTLDGTRLTPATRIIRVTVPFDKPPVVVGNAKAALKGFLVNGEPLADYSKDRTDYTIQAGQTEQVSITPVTEDGQTVVAGDTRQTAYTTVQEWKVSCDGDERTYTVSIVREHEPTAAERFTPQEGTALVSETPNPGADNTKLASVGYMMDGKYTPTGGDDLTIPEGGTIAWESYSGQVVIPTVTRVDGSMTWRYDLGVLSADRAHWETRTLLVTYLTAATHSAVLSDISVDGKNLPDFEPDSYEYETGVENPDRYVVTPRFDRSTGMSVTTHKDGSKVVMTTMSADGLTSETYTVTVHRNVLASTGMRGFVSMLLLAAGMAAASLWETWRRRQTRSGSSRAA